MVNLESEYTRQSIDRNIFVVFIVKTVSKIFNKNTLAAPFESLE